MEIKNKNQEPDDPTGLRENDASNPVTHADTKLHPAKRSRKKLIIVIAAVILLVVVCAVIVSKLRHHDASQTMNEADFAAYYAAKPDVVTKQTFDCHPRTKDHEWYRTDQTLTIDPTDPNILYTSVEWKGVFKSTDGGKTWKQKTKGIKVYARSDDLSRGCYSEYPSIQIDPNDHKHLVLATSGGGGGFLDDTTLNSQTGGAYQSFDGGENWQLLINNKMNFYTSDVAIDPTDSKTLYYATSSNPSSWDGADQSKIFVTKGLIYKTTDGGKSWQELPTGIGYHSSVLKVLVNPKNPKELTAPTFSANRQSANGTGTGVSSGKDFSVGQLGILHSLDGGQTWSMLLDIPGNPAFLSGFVAPTNYQHMYFVPVNAANEEPHGYVLLDGKTLHKTKYMDHVTYDPFDPTGNHALAFTSISIGPSSQNLTLYETIDGGLNWAKRGTLPQEIKDPNEGTTKISKIVWSPKDPKTIYMSGGSGLIWKSTDMAQTWAKLLDYTQLPK